MVCVVEMLRDTLRTHWNGVGRRWRLGLHTNFKVEMAMELEMNRVRLTSLFNYGPLLLDRV